MQRFISTTLGAVAAVFGLLIALPTISYQNAIWVIQMLLGEFSWLPGVLGLSAVGLGAMPKRRSSWAVVLGGFGVLTSLLPFIQVRRTALINDSEMRAALGPYYERQISPIMRTRVSPTRWSIENSYGFRRWNPPEIKVEHDIVYTHTPQRTLMLDVYRPKAHPAHGSRYPAVIVIHGGAWRYGDKGEVFTPHNRYLAGLGYVVYDIQYRLSHEARWPAALEDVRAAIRWVKRYAAAYDVDAERIALLGRSAGGHLALLAGYGDAADTEVAAVVAIYAPTDLRMWMSLPDNEVTNFLGGTTVQQPQAYAASSPLEMVREGLPPTLLVQGYRDDLVAPPHTEMLANKLLAARNTVVTLRLPWARHGFDAFLSGLGSQMIQYDIDRFLAWRLYHEDPDE